jgi:type II secretory pathway component PulJ
VGCFLKKTNTMKNKTNLLLKLLLMAMLVYGLFACQPDIETISRRQGNQLSEVRAMRTAAMAGMERRRQLRAAALEQGERTDSLSRFFLGTHYRP